MTLQEASKKLDISKKRLWRAVKSGFLEAQRVQKGGRWEYRVTTEQVESYRRRYLDSLEMRAVDWDRSESKNEAPSVKSGEKAGVESMSLVRNNLAELCRETERSELSATLLLEKLSAVERRNAGLELEIAQMDKLLTESDKRYSEQQFRCQRVEKILSELKSLL